MVVRMRMIECRVEVGRSAIDGIEERISSVAPTRWTIREDRLTGRAWLAGFFDSRGEAEAAWRKLAATFEAPWVLGPARLRRLPDREWRDSYKAHFKAWHVGGVHWAPIWMRAMHQAPREAVVVWLDPGLAFGTGNHPTTRLCCERLVAYVRTAPVRAPAAPGSVAVIDAGCGSGILAISAARLGLRPVFGFDNDPEAIRVSRRNATANGISGQLRLCTSDLREGLAGRKAGLVLANIEADVLMRARHDLVRTILPGGWLVLGGILARELQAVRAAFAFTGPTWKASTRRMGEWVDLVLKRAP